MQEAAHPGLFDETFGRSAPEVYERHFVPAIGLPVARDLVEAARLEPGEKVLDVACGTGVVARLASEEVAPGGTVVGVDVNAGMLEVARSVTTTGTAIQWYEAPAETMPLPDETFDAVLCQLSFQFFADKAAALREMHRVTAPGGRLALNVPGQITEMFEILADALARHVDPSLEGFVRQVFSLPEPAEVMNLVNDAGFSESEAAAAQKTLRLPAPEKFLWQYILSTPLSQPVSQIDDSRRSALERDVVPKWQKFVENGGMKYEQDIIVASARK